MTYTRGNAARHCANTIFACASASALPRVAITIGRSFMQKSNSIQSAQIKPNHTTPAQEPYAGSVFPTGPGGRPSPIKPAALSRMICSHRAISSFRCCR